MGVTRFSELQMVGSVKGGSVRRTQATAYASQTRKLPEAPSWQNASKDHPIKRGQGGESVNHLQQELNKQGFKLEEDGKFGKNTEAAVLAFQKRAGIQVDGKVGPETIAALEGRSLSDTAQVKKKEGAKKLVSSEEVKLAPTEADKKSGDSGQKAGNLALSHTPGTRGPTGSSGKDSAGNSFVRGDLGQVTLKNGATLTGPGGQAGENGHGGYKADGSLAKLQRGDARVDVGRVQADVGPDTVKLDATALSATTGDDNQFDVGSKIGDIGGEVTLRATKDEGRIGAGYRANIAEVNAGVGEVSAKSQDDYREEFRLSAGAPSGGAFVSWNDRDGDGKKNYRIDVDVPIPFTPLGVGFSAESENPVKDGLALVASLNPITAIPAAGYRLGRALKFW
jgi:hypothetical protein